MDNKLTLLAVTWLSGFIAGVIFVASRRRMGERQLATAMPAPVGDAPSTPSGNKVQRAAQRVAGPVVAAAKADLLRVRNATRSVGHRDTPTVDVSETESTN